MFFSVKLVTVTSNKSQVVDLSIVYIHNTILTRKKVRVIARAQRLQDSVNGRYGAAIRARLRRENAKHQEVLNCSCYVFLYLNVPFCWLSTFP